MTSVDGRRPLTLVGCGAIMVSGHAPAIATLDSDCYVDAVVDISAERRDLLGDRFDVPPGRRVGSLGDVSPAPAGGLAVVAVPTPALPSAVTRAAEAGFSVLAEKPLAWTAGAARAVAASNGRVRVVHNYLCRSDVRQAQALLSSGTIGTPRLIRLEQHDPEHFPGQGDDPTWRRRGVRGCLLDNAYHWIYLAEVLAGTPVSEVIAQTAGTGQEDLALLGLRHADNVLTAVQVGWVPKRATRVLEVHGTEGSLRLLGGGSGCELILPGRPVTVVEPPSTESSYLTFYRAVFAALRQRKAFAASIDDCLRVLTVIDAAYRSASEGRAVRVETGASR